MIWVDQSQQQASQEGGVESEEREDMVASDDEESGANGPELVPSKPNGKPTFSGQQKVVGIHCGKKVYYENTAAFMLPDGSMKSLSLIKV